MLEQPAFGMRLRALRLERGLSQAALAEGGLSTGYLSRLESGARPPTDRVVEHLMMKLGVPESAFEADEQTPSLARVLATVMSAENDNDLSELLADSLRTADKLDPAERWQALWLLARARDMAGLHEEEYKLLTELAALSDDLDVPELRARARTRLSRCARLLGDSTMARQHAEEARELMGGLSVTDQAAALHALISAEAESGRLLDARAHADELCELTANSTGSLLVEALWAAATVRIRQSDHAEAKALLERALSLLDSREDLMLWVRLRLAAVSLYLQITPALISSARARLDEVASAVELVGTDLYKQQLLALSAHLAFEENRIDDARALCARLDEQQLLLSFRDRLRFEALRAQLRIIDGDREEGSRALQQLAQQAQDSLNIELAADIWRSLAKMLSTAYGRDVNKTE